MPPAPSLRTPVADPPLPVRGRKAIIEEYLALNEKRLELDRESARLQKELAPIKRQLMATVLAEATGKAREITTCGYRLSILSRKG